MKLLFESSPKITVPVFLAGMWPSLADQPESGTRVALVEKEGGPILLQGFTDLNGDFRGRLPASWVGKKVLVVVREPGFKYNYFSPAILGECIFPMKRA